MSDKKQPLVAITNLSTSRSFNSFLKKVAFSCLRSLRLRKSVSLVLAGDKKIKELNKIYRRKNRVTDVLSFGDWDIPDFLGEIVICLPQARRQAKRFGVALKEELARLLVHAILHLVGYDHEGSRKEAEKMFGLQEKMWRHVTRNT